MTSGHSGASGFQAWVLVWLEATSKAWIDDAFKTKLLKDPREALKTAFGYHLPKNIDLVVIDLSDASNTKSPSPAADFDTALFSGHGQKTQTTLSVPLLAAPTALVDGLVHVNSVGKKPGVECVCACV